MTMKEAGKEGNTPMFTLTPEEWEQAESDIVQLLAENSELVGLEHIFERMANPEEAHKMYFAEVAIFAARLQCSVISAERITGKRTEGNPSDRLGELVSLLEPIIGSVAHLSTVSGTFELLEYPELPQFQVLAEIPAN